MNIRISYKDNQNWTDVNGNVSEWTNLREVYKNQRVQPAYIAPEITTDTWNGITFDVQHVRYDAFYIEFWVKESELNEISRLQSCKTIIVTDLDNNIYHEIDVPSSDYLEFTEPERIADTSNWKVSFTYKINKTVINKGSLNPLQTNNIYTSFDDGTTTTNNTFYTDYDVLTTQEDTALDQYSNEFGYNTTSKAISNNTSLVLFYMTRANANTLKKEFERAQTITVNGTSVLENRIVEYTEIGEGLIKLVVSCLTESVVNYPLDV